MSVFRFDPERERPRYEQIAASNYPDREDPRRELMVELRMAELAEQNHWRDIEELAQRTANGVPMGRPGDAAVGPLTVLLAQAGERTDATIAARSAYRLAGGHYT